MGVQGVQYKPLSLTNEQKDLIISSLIKSEPLAGICEDMGFTPFLLFKYLKTDPQFETEIKAAREEAIEHKVDALENITKNCKSLIDTTAARIQSENIKWIASKRKPKDYGDNINVNHVHNIDLSQVLAAAEGRVIPLLEAKARLVLPVDETPENQSSKSLTSTRIPVDSAIGMSQSEMFKQSQQLNDIDQTIETDEALAPVKFEDIC